MTLFRLVLITVAAVVAAAFFAAVVRCSSSRTSSSRVFRSSLEARLNSLMLRPSERPSSGSLRGPKMSSAITPDSIDRGPSQRGRTTNRRNASPAIETATATANTPAIQK